MRLPFLAPKQAPKLNLPPNYGEILYLGGLKVHQIQNNPFLSSVRMLLTSLSMTSKTDSNQKVKPSAPNSTPPSTKSAGESGSDDNRQGFSNESMPTWAPPEHQPKLSHQSTKANSPA
jgi:hypothetical protein